MAETAAAKVCIHCGQDCAKKARTKDGQAAVARAARAPSLPARPIEVKRPAIQSQGDPDDQGTISSLLSQVKMSACGSCGAPMEAGSTFCTRCGVNPQTGQRVSTRVEKAVKEPKVRTRRGPSALLDPTWSGLGALVILGGVLALGMSNADALPFVAVVVLLYVLVFGIWMLIDAFRTSVGTGLLYIFLPFYGFYYGLARCENGFLKTHWAIGLVAGIVVRFLPWGEVAGAT
jgi:hypothetical protein